MNKVNVKIVLEDGVKMPEYKTEGAAGFDICANKVINYYSNVVPKTIEEHFVIAPYSRILVGTGIFVELPVGKVMDIRTRSGIAAKDGIMVLNSPGTIDHDYRGEIGVILYNSSNSFVQYKFGERVAQCVILDAYQAEFEQVSKLSETERGAGGFGHTGK